MADDDARSIERIVTMADSGSENDIYAICHMNMRKRITILNYFQNLFFRITYGLFCF